MKKNQRFFCLENYLWKQVLSPNEIVDFTQFLPQKNRESIIPQFLHCGTLQPLQQKVCKQIQKHCNIS